jgi:DNA polymerase-4
MRDILHLSIPAFPIAVARVADAALRGRPVAVAPLNSERALLHCVSAEARAEGVHEGMAIYRARRLCPALSVIPPDPRLTGRAGGALRELLLPYTPLWEPTAPGRFFLDLSGSRRLLGPGRDAAARLEREIGDRLRLTGQLGVAGNKLVSRIAAGCLERPGICDVLRGSEAAFLGPLPVTVLPGVGAVRQALLLEELNLRRVGELADLTAAALQIAFGPFGALLHQRAQGVDPSPVRPPQRTLCLLREAFLPRADNDSAQVAAALCRLVEECGLALRGAGRGTGRLRLCVRYADGVEERTTHPFARPEHRDERLLAAASALLERAGKRRVRVAGLQLECTPLLPRDRQLELFAIPDADAERRERLQDALDTLRRRHGMEAVRRGMEVVGEG